MDNNPTRAAIVDAAEALLVGRGFKGMTIDAVAEAAGIGKGTVYLSFASKTELAIAVIRRREEYILDRLSEIGSLEEFLVERVVLRFDRYQDLPQGVDATLAGAAQEWRSLRRELAMREGGLLEHLGADLQTSEAMLIATEALLPFSFTYEALGERSALQDQARAVSRLLAGRKDYPVAGDSLLEKLERLHY